MTREERRVKKYVDAWCEGKRVQYWCKTDSGYMELWNEVAGISTLLFVLRSAHKFRIVKGVRK